MRLFAVPAALAYVLWGILYIYLGVTGLNDLAVQQMIQIDGGLLATFYFNHIWEGSIVFILGVFFIWRNNVVAYWLAAVIANATEAGNVLFSILPGLVTDFVRLAGPPLGATGLVLSFLAMLTRPKRQRSHEEFE